jgi:hypothetical protein
MGSTIDPVEFGELKATVIQAKETMDKFETQITTLTATVTQLNQRLDKARNWWQLLLIQGAIISAAASAGAWIWDHVRH